MSAGERQDQRDLEQERINRGWEQGIQRITEEEQSGHEDDDGIEDQDEVGTNTDDANIARPGVQVLLPTDQGAILD